jgi:hypothetical protein
MTRETDLANRIARLEQLLDQLEQSRVGGRASTGGNAVAAATDRVREVMEMLRDRQRQSLVDQADALAMRTLLEEVRSLTAELRAETGRLQQGLETASTDLRQVHRRLDDAENV